MLLQEFPRGHLMGRRLQLMARKRNLCGIKCPLESFFADHGVAVVHVNKC